jgi:2-(1,2-epoxy-1,2-dihydrophenyl)acetyl-CoA isomerase
MVITKENGVVYAKLNVPERLNPLTAGVRIGLKRIIEDVRWDDDAKVLVITGEGRGFCSGADLSPDAPPGYKPPETRWELEDPRYAWIARFRAMDKPVIAAVNGVAAGGGLALALMCDMRIAAASARFISVFARRALIPDNATSWLLPRIVGTSQALRMILTGDDVRADEALRIGLADQVVPDEDLMTTVRELAERIARGPSVTLELSKRLVYQGLTRDIYTQGIVESAFASVVADTEDVREGRLAFRERRQPNFQGR